MYSSRKYEEFIDSFVALWDVLYGDKADVLVDFLNLPIDLFPFDWKTKKHLNRLQLVTINDLIIFGPECVLEVRNAIGLVLLSLQAIMHRYEKRASLIQTSPPFRDKRLRIISRVIEERAKRSIESFEDIENFSPSDFGKRKSKKGVDKN